MQMSRDWFYGKTEGFLGDENDFGLMFVLKEPNSSGKEADPDHFWFREVVDGCKKGGRYLSALGRIAQLLFNHPLENSPNGWSSALRRCAYINLFPEKGERTASLEYQTVLRSFREGVDDPYHRWDIIMNLPVGTTLVTTKDIFRAIRQRLDGLKIPAEDFFAYGLAYGNKMLPSFSFRNNNGQIIVMAMYHPANRRYGTATAVHRGYT